MKSDDESTPGKIAIRGKGVGGITGSEVEQRALELALIDGRSEPTAEDRQRARKELQGETLPDAIEEDNDASVGLTRDPSEPPSDTGHQIPDREGLDEEVMTERLALEGVEEAQHDQMLQARRKKET